MKLILILSVLFSNYSCSQDSDLLKIEYQARTRGASKSIMVTKNNYTANILGNKSEVMMSPKEWNQFTQLVNAIQLSDIPNLEAPSHTSAADRKMSATIRIFLKDKVYESAKFDDGNPPKELKALVEKLFSQAEIED